VLDGLVYLHACGVWHRDLKPQNILVREYEQPSVVISDFGLAVHTHQPTLCDGFIGTLEFAAPELVFGGNYSEKVDCWALGVTMYTCLTNRNPFEPLNQFQELATNIAYSDFSVEEVPEGISNQAAELMARLLANQDHQRPSALEALNHPWFDDLRGSAVGCLEENGPSEHSDNSWCE
jgi:serine/threonine protein kinase